MRAAWGHLLVAVGAGGRLWVAWEHPYRVEEWDTAGNRRAEFIRRADWFPTRRRGSQLSDSVGGPLPSHIAGMWEDERGLLWIMSYVPDDRWIHAPRRERRRRLETNAGLAIRQGGYDMVIEIVDPGSGSLIASERFAGPEGAPSRWDREVGGGHLRIWTEEGEGGRGDRPIRVLRARLEGYPG